MTFLLDTDVLSEPTKPRPNAGVLAWLSSVDEDQVFISVVSFTEIRYGIELLAAGARRRTLDRWLQLELPHRFAGRTLPIDAAVADACGTLMARRASVGRRIADRDAFIAATAQVHGLTLVTRNVSHFQASSSNILNPWI